MQSIFSLSLFFVLYMSNYNYRSLDRWKKKKNTLTGKEKGEEKRRGKKLEIKIIESELTMNEKYA